LKRSKLLGFLPYVIVIGLITAIYTSTATTARETFAESKFYEVLQNQQVNDISISYYSTVIEIKGSYLKAGEKNTTSFTISLPNTEDINNKLHDAVYQNVPATKITVTNPYKANAWAEIIPNLVMIVAMGGITIFLFSRLSNNNNKAFDFTKNRARLEKDIKVRFDDVAGCDEEKEEMKEIIDYLRKPEKFAKMGAKMPKGILMVGSPGTGKTLLAKAVAGEADVPFYSISGSDFVEMFVGVGASRVREMFKVAEKTAPCIIFIDEIDAVGRQRGAGVGGGNDEREQTLNQLLVQMDGIGENKGIVIIAATNRPDVLDPALLRPGRFDRQVTISMPDKAGRTAILKVHAKNKKLSTDINLEALASRTPGFSGADLANVLNEAAIMAVRREHEIIDMSDLDEAIDRVMAGPAKKSRKYTEKERKLVSIHESGHAVIGLFVPDANVVQKVTIIPRGDAGGYNLMTPPEDVMFHTKSQLEAEIISLLGGRVAEEVVLGEISTGASNDIEKATQIAKSMVNAFGMSDIGPIQYNKGDGNVFLGRDYTSNKSVSDKVAYEIDQEVRKIIDKCHKIATVEIKKHRDTLDIIVNALLENETLTKENLDNIVKYGSIEAPKETEETK